MQTVILKMRYDFAAAEYHNFLTHLYATNHKLIPAAVALDVIL